MVINDHGKICFEEGDIVCVSRMGIETVDTIKEACDPDDDHGINHYILESEEYITEYDIDYDKTVEIFLSIKNKEGRNNLE